MCCKHYHIIFSTFSLKFKCKICIQKEVIHNFKNHIFGHMTSYKLTHLKKMVRVWKTKSLLFCLRYDPLIVFRRQNHITFIFIKMMSHNFLVQMAYWAIAINILTLPPPTSWGLAFSSNPCRFKANYIHPGRSPSNIGLPLNNMGLATPEECWSTHGCH